ARGDHDFLIPQDDRLADLALNPFGDPDWIADVADFVDEHRKFISAKPRDRVVRALSRFGFFLRSPENDIRKPQAFMQAAADFDDELVAAQVTQAVINPLKPIEIDKKDGEAVVLVSPRPSHREFEPFQKQRSVWQRRQWIM